MFQSNLPYIFWSYALLHAATLINIIPTPFLKNESPYQKLYSALYDVNLLRVFGCLCYTSTLNANRKKLDPKALPCVFLGFKSHKKGYIVYNLHTRTIEVSRHVIFYENCFPFSTININDPTILAHPSITTHNPQAFSFPIYSPSPSPLPPQSEPVPINQPNTNHTSSAPTPRRTDRIQTRPTKYIDYQTSFTSAIVTNHPGTKHPISSVISYNKLSLSYHSFILNVSANSEPKSYNEACKHDSWVQAMHDEISALERNNTWVLTDLPQHKNVIGCKWVYKMAIITPRKIY